MQNNIGQIAKLTTVEWYDDRFYKRVFEDKRVDYYPSITTKLGVVEKPFLARWRGSIGNREADLQVYEAQERGSRIHYAWYVLNQGGAVAYNPSKAPNFDPKDLDTLREENKGSLVILDRQDEMLDLWKLKRFLEALKPEIVAGELNVYSDRYREAGTVDNVFKIKEGEYNINGRTPLALRGGFYIADLKTGTTFDDNAYMQQAAYASMYQETYGVEIEGTMGIHTGAKTKTGIPGLAVYVRTREEWQQDFADFRNVSLVWERKNKDLRPALFDFPALIKL